MYYELTNLYLWGGKRLSKYDPKSICYKRDLCLIHNKNFCMAKHKSKVKR